MKILSFTRTFISKFKAQNIVAYEKFQLLCHKRAILQKTRCSFIASAYRCFTVSNTFRADNVSPKSGKYFQETENEYAHEVMEKLPNYSNTILKYPFKIDEYTLKNKESCEHLNVFEKFIKVTLDNLSESLSIETSKYTDVVQSVCSSLSQASDEEIQRMLHYLCMWPPTQSTTTPNFKVLWNMLDVECVKRMKNWDVSQQLLIADYWFQLRLSRITRYNREVIFNLVKNIDPLLNHQVVQLMFYINVQRKIPEFLVSNLEKKLESVINCVTLEEVGIICLGYFKTENKISNTVLLQSIIKQFMYNVENVDTITVAAILKFLRKSLNHSLKDLYILTLHKCISCINSWDIPTSVHLALLSSECNVYHPLLLNCVSEKLAYGIDNARLKDCAKLLCSLSMHNHFEGIFHDKFFSELQKEERQREIISHPVHVIQSALFYSYMGHFNYELLAKIFDKQFFENSCVSFPYICMTYAEIDYCVEIECQDYTGPKLDATVRNVLQSRRGHLPSKSNKQTMQTKLLNNIYELLIEILGSDQNILIRHILPHLYAPDIIVRVSKFRNKSLSGLYEDFPSHLILKPPSNEVWVSFVVCGIYSFAYRSTKMTGVTSMKLRQLQKIGYHVVFIPYYDLPQDKPRRKQFLEEKLNTLEEKYKQCLVE